MFELLLLFVSQVTEHVHYLLVGLYKCLNVIGIYLSGYGTHPLPVSGTVQVFDMLLVFICQAMEHIRYL